MSPFLRVAILSVVLALFPARPADCRTVEGPDKATILLTPDFDHDGRIGETDLILLMERNGALKGSPEYLIPLDLNRDDSIDDQDILLFIREWKSQNPTPEPVTQQDLRDNTGFTDLLAGQTWRLECLSDGSRPCDSIVRVVSAGTPILLGTREVVPIDYGPEGEAPWNRFYLDVSEGVSIAGIEIVTPITRLPGVNAPSQEISLSGPIPMIEPGMVTPETAVVGNGTASAVSSFSLPPPLDRLIPFSKGLFNSCEECNFFCDCDSRSFCENLFAIFTVASGNARAVCDWIDFLNLKGDEQVASGTVSIEVAWEILFDDDGLQFANLSYTFEGLTKFLSLNRLPDLGPCSLEVEPNDSLALAQGVAINQCITGEVGQGGDTADFFSTSIAPGEQGTLTVTLDYDGFGALATLYNISQQPVQSEFLSGPGSFSFNPIAAEPGEDFSLGLNADGGLNYDVRFDVVP